MSKSKLDEALMPTLWDTERPISQGPGKRKIRRNRITENEANKQISRNPLLLKAKDGDKSVLPNLTPDVDEAKRLVKGEFDKSPRILCGTCLWDGKADQPVYLEVTTRGKECVGAMAVKLQCGVAVRKNQFKPIERIWVQFDSRLAETRPQHDADFSKDKNKEAESEWWEHRVYPSFYKAVVRKVQFDRYCGKLKAKSPFKGKPDTPEDQATDGTEQDDLVRDRSSSPVDRNGMSRKPVVKLEEIRVERPEITSSEMWDTYDTDLINLDLEDDDTVDAIRTGWARLKHRPVEEAPDARLFHKFRHFKRIHWFQDQTRCTQTGPYIVWEPRAPLEVTELWNSPAHSNMLEWIFGMANKKEHFFDPTKVKNLDAVITANPINFSEMIDESAESVEEQQTGGENGGQETDGMDLD